MKNVKMSLANIQGKLSRKELKNIMAGFEETLDGDACATKKCKTTSGTSDCYTSTQAGAGCICWARTDCA